MVIINLSLTANDLQTTTNDFPPNPNDGQFFIIIHCPLLGFGGKSFVDVCKSFAVNDKFMITIFIFDFLKN